MNRLRRAILQTLVLAAFIGAGAAQAASPAQVTSFFRAVQMDDPKTAGALLAGGINPNQLNPIGGEPAVVQALREDAMRVFDMLLSQPGINLETAAFNGNTALMMAAFKGNLPAVQALLAKGARVNQPGWTALHYAAAGGAADIARLLIERGAKLDAVSPLASGSYTPLMMAAREGQDAMVALLLDAGAPVGSKNSEGLTAAQIAERADKGRIAAMIARQPASR